MSVDTDRRMAVEALDGIRRMIVFVLRPQVQAALNPPKSLGQALAQMAIGEGRWIGFGLVGVWAALDAFRERAELDLDGQCALCERQCLAHAFAATLDASDRPLLEELEDLRNLYAHNFAGIADERYFGRRRHLLVAGTPITLPSGATFDGQRISLQLATLEAHVDAATRILLSG